jgi:alkylated DNA nucleotide flippase Atl1
MPTKTYNEKLNNAGGLPRVEDMSDNPKKVARYGGAKMLIAAPMQYNEIMARIPEGKITTIDRMRTYLADQAGATVTCPLTAGIFINVCAHASQERETDKIPWWRTLKAKGELNEKFPPGQKLMLEAEGHIILDKGKRSFVADYEGSVAQL